MSQYPNAKFVTSANKVGQFLPDTGSEVAFAGRSNSGKSSAINVIVNRRQFARTSKTPGRTQLVNFFDLRDAARLVDLPGYGYARVADSVQEHWGRLLTTYLQERSSLNGLFLIVDVRRGIGDYDRQLLELAESLGLRVARRSVDLVALLQEQLCEVGPVLAGDSTNQRSGHALVYRV